MINSFQLYMIIKLDSIVEIFHGFSVLFGMMCFLLPVFMFFTLLFKDQSYDKEEIATANKCMTYFIKWFKRAVLWCAICIVVGNFVPTTKEMAAIYVIPKVANSQFVNETFPNELKEIYGMSKDWMKDFLKTQKETVETAITQAVSNKVESVKQ
jgi:TRAP-type C4-dicarboxylate transport system permease large subunit